MEEMNNVTPATEETVAETPAAKAKINSIFLRARMIRVCAVLTAVVLLGVGYAFNCGVVTDFVKNLFA